MIKKLDLIISLDHMDFELEKKFLNREIFWHYGIEVFVEEIEHSFNGMIEVHEYTLTEVKRIPPPEY